MTGTEQTPSVGGRLKQIRIGKRITLRDLSKRVDMDAGNYSRVERGVFAPPPDERLGVILDVLGVEGIERQELMDKAAIERGQLPHDLQDDATLARELPILFRAIRMRDADALDQFIDAVRAGGDSYSSGQ